MNEITQEELYDRLIQFGLFARELPPVLTGEAFLSYCKTDGRPVFEDRWYDYATYNSMRNMNLPRIISIPVPMGYERLCKCLSENWGNLKVHFQDATSEQERIISRTHIRKMKDTESLFSMNYDNWEKDGTPEPEILIGKKYLVCADISNCYPSVYTHAIAWALAGKSTAKQTVAEPKRWYNQIDHFTQAIKNGETHGLLIGPHASSLLSEIILCAVDKQLAPKWDYYRHIDDFKCYVDSYDNAGRFLGDLRKALGEYGLSLNHKKTEIHELPVPSMKQWVRQIQDYAALFQAKRPYVDYKEVKRYFDLCASLMQQNDNNYSIMLYALKILSNDSPKHKLTLSENAKKYVEQWIMALSLLNSYLVPQLDKHMFTPFGISKNRIQEYSTLLYDTYFKVGNYESCAYALFFALKYDFDLGEYFNLENVIAANDCILSLMALLYCKKRSWRSGIKILKDHAKVLRDSGEMDSQWPFVYECLNGSLSGDWKTLKKAKVSFVKKGYQ